MTMTAGFFFRCSPRRAGRRGVRTEDMGNTKTGEMGNTIDWADALEKRTGVKQGSGLNGAKLRKFWDAALAGQIVVFPRDPWVAPQPRARGLSPVGA